MTTIQSGTGNQYLRKGRIVRLKGVCARRHIYKGVPQKRRTTFALANLQSTISNPK